MWSIFVLLCLATQKTLTLPTNTVDVITEPKPGQEYVYVQSSSSGSRPIERKDKIDQERPFETAHKLPPSLTFTLNKDVEEKTTEKNGKVKREAADKPAPAPAGAIKLDVQKLLEKYKTELKSSTTPRTTTSSTTTTKRTSRRRNSNRRIKKEAKEEVTSPAPVLTTGVSAPKPVDDDDNIPLVASGSEKQRSRIQIKKGPNGQEYEYEYVYYYYDDDDDVEAGGDKKKTEPISNAHDGPAKNEKKQNNAEPEANEVLPSSRATTTKQRGRQLGEEETVNEERLPANTRFPPRSRNLNTTPLPEEEAKVTTRGRTRGRPSTETAPISETDNVSDETQGSRGRTRANVRRPSLDFVDSETFNTHTSNGGEPPANGGPTFPTDLPAGPVRFLGATPNERIEITEENKSTKQPAPVNENVDETVGSTNPTINDETTTAMSAMDKVALDLYAILQGTQKLSGEEDVKTDGEDTVATTVEIVTDVETTTPTTTTTTTTTTTPAPTTTTTTTTTTEAPIGRNRYRNRGNNLRKTAKHGTSSSTTEASSDNKQPKSKFGRNSFNGKRNYHGGGGRTTAEPEVAKEEAKPVSNSKPTLGRSRFGASRPRTRTTASPVEDKEQESSSPATTNHHKPSLPRSRPSFNNLRSRTRTTAAPTDEEASHQTGDNAESSTTARSRRVSAGGSGGVRPLRPGPRINLSGGRGRVSSTTTEQPAAEEHVNNGDEVVEHAGGEEAEEKPAEAAPVDNSPLGRLRNKNNRLNVQARPKAAASAPVQVRRTNPLLSRRRPGQTTEATSSEAPQEQSAATDAVEAANEEIAETEASVSSTTTTEEPRGLNKLLAGRRRLAAKQNHKAE